jgi:hypothetical protein
MSASMKAGLASAQREHRGDRGGPERAFDTEYGFDVDPFETHACLFFKPSSARSGSV